MTDIQPKRGLTGLETLAIAKPLFYIWGCQGVAGAALEIFGKAPASERVRLLLLLAALLLSLPALIRLAKGGFAHPAILTRVGMPVAILLVTALVVRHTGVAGPFFIDLFRALVMAFFYILIGLFLGRRFIALGVWLLALCVVLVYRYIGFTPVVLQGFGGLSLIACGYLVSGFLRPR